MKFPISFLILIGLALLGCQTDKSVKPSAIRDHSKSSSLSQSLPKKDENEPASIQSEWYFIGNKLTWENAKKRCKALGMRLPAKDDLGAVSNNQAISPQFCQKLKKQQLTAKIEPNWEEERWIWIGESCGDFCAYRLKMDGCILGTSSGTNKEMFDHVVTESAVCLKAE